MAPIVAEEEDKLVVVTVYIKVEAVLTDNSTLYIREYVSRDNRMYSYHWQDEQGNMI